MIFSSCSCCSVAVYEPCIIIYPVFGLTDLFVQYNQQDNDMCLWYVHCGVRKLSSSGNYSRLPDDNLGEDGGEQEEV